MLRINVAGRPLRLLAVLLVVVGALGLCGAGDRIGVQEQRDVAARSWVVVPIETSTDLGLLSASFGLGYSPDLLTPFAVYTTPLTRGFELGFDLDTPGELSVDIRGQQPLFESGSIVWVLFRSHGAVGDATELILHHALINGIDAAVAESGAVEFGVGQVTLGFATDLTAETGEVFTAPLSVDDATGILALDVEIEFDPLVISAISVARTALSQSFSLTVNLADPGVIEVSLFGTQPMVGSGSIVDIDFEVLGQADQSTPIDLLSAEINEGAIVATLEDGLFVVCDGSDADGDGVSSCDGDCDDDDDGRYPGNLEIGCDGIDQDCDAATSDILDDDDDGFACDVDCNDDNPEVHPDAEEICDGLDNDCDLEIDNVPHPVELVWADGVDEADPTLAWMPVAAATGYDVFRGILSGLHASDGDFSQAPGSCLDDDTADTFIDDTDIPPLSDAFWYIIRPTNCGGSGSYEGGGAAQEGPRDTEADASPQSCS